MSNNYSTTTMSGVALGIAIFLIILAALAVLALYFPNYRKVASNWFLKDKKKTAIKGSAAVALVALLSVLIKKFLAYFIVAGFGIYLLRNKIKDIEWLDTLRRKAQQEEKIGKITDITYRTIGRYSMTLPFEPPSDRADIDVTTKDIDGCTVFVVSVDVKRNLVINSESEELAKKVFQVYIMREWKRYSNGTGKTSSGDGNFKYITIVDVRLGAFRAEVDLVVCDTPADTEFLLNSRIDNDDDGNVSYDDEEF